MALVPHGYLQPLTRVPPTLPLVHIYPLARDTSTSPQIELKPFIVSLPSLPPRMTEREESVDFSEDLRAAPPRRLHGDTTWRSEGASQSVTADEPVRASDPRLRAAPSTPVFGRAIFHPNGEPDVKMEDVQPDLDPAPLSPVSLGPPQPLRDQLRPRLPASAVPPLQAPPPPAVGVPAPSAPNMRPPEVLPPHLNTSVIADPVPEVVPSTVLVRFSEVIDERHFDLGVLIQNFGTKITAEYAYAFMVQAPFKAVWNVLMRHGKTMKYFTKMCPDDNRMVMLPLKRKAQSSRARRQPSGVAGIPPPMTPPATSASAEHTEIPQPCTPPRTCGPTPPAFPPLVAAAGSNGAPALSATPVSRGTERIAARIASGTAPAARASNSRSATQSSATSSAPNASPPNQSEMPDRPLRVQHHFYSGVSLQPTRSRTPRRSDPPPPPTTRPESASASQPSRRARIQNLLLSVLDAMED